MGIGRSIHSPVFRSSSLTARAVVTASVRCDDAVMLSTSSSIGRDATGLPSAL